MHIESVDLQRATDRQYSALNAFTNLIRAERLPDDPPVPLAVDIRRWQNIPGFIRTFQWIVWDDGDATVIAGGSVNVFQTKDNRHLAEFSIAVAPEHRRRGIGTQLLERIAEATAREGRSLLITSTSDRVPVGETFPQHIGARVGLESHTYQLELKDLDRGLIRRWIERAKERAAEFDLVAWTEGFPDTELGRAADLRSAMNRAPRGDLQIEDMQWTAEEVRQIQLADCARGAERWTMVVQERPTGAFAGYTEVLWHPSHPELLQQGDTAVLLPYQNRGLGRWLKAAMVEKVLHDRPQVTKIRTGNADANAPMVKINHELGFRPFISHRAWQVELPQVQTHLNSVRSLKLA